MEQQSKPARTPPKGKPTPKRPRVKARDYRENRNASATKSGPGRFALSGAPGNRLIKPRPTRAYKALMDSWASMRVTKAPLRDEHGAVTLIGKRYELEGVHPSSREVVLEGWVDGDDFGYTVQRKWLAGVSAQRGY